MLHSCLRCGWPSITREALAAHLSKGTCTRRDPSRASSDSGNRARSRRRRRHRARHRGDSNGSRPRSRGRRRRRRVTARSPTPVLLPAGGPLPAGSARARPLVVSPAWREECVVCWHPDDAGFGKGGLLAGMRERGAGVFTHRAAGSAPSLSPAAAASPWNPDPVQAVPQPRDVGSLRSPPARPCTDRPPPPGPHDGGAMPPRPRDAWAPPAQAGYAGAPAPADTAAGGAGGSDENSGEQERMATEVEWVDCNKKGKKLFCHHCQARHDGGGRRHGW